MADEIEAQAGQVDTEAQGAAEDTHDEAFDKDRALATIRAQRENEKAMAKRLKEAEASLKVYLDKDKERQEADLSELEKTKKRMADLELAHKEAVETVAALRLRQAFSQETAKAGMKFLNPQAEADAFELADLENVEVAADGTVSGLDHAIKALQKSRPYLFVSDPSAGQGTPKRVPGNNVSASRETAKSTLPLINF